LHADSRVFVNEVRYKSRCLTGRTFQPEPADDGRSVGFDVAFGTMGPTAFAGHEVGEAISVIEVTPSQR